MRAALIILSLCILADGQLYHSMVPETRAAGALAKYASFTFYPPLNWGSTGMADGVYDTLPSGDVPYFDQIIISLVGINAQITGSTSPNMPWAPFYRYPDRNWQSMNYQQFPVTVTGSPPCTFYASVSPDGISLTLALLSCANSTTTLGHELMDMLTVNVPWHYLSTNPEFPEMSVITQAVFKTVQKEGYPPTYLTSMPTQVLTPWVTTTSELGLSSLQYLKLVPGAPELGIPINTIAGSKLQALSATIQLGMQLQAGNTITLDISLGTWAEQNPLGVIFADPADVNATPIAVGPGCKKSEYLDEDLDDLDDVHCCSKSTGIISVPFPSLLSAPSWWSSLQITLGPVGCVLPADKQFTFVIPEGYLGQNPSEIVSLVGYVHIDSRIYTSAEPEQRLVQQLSEETLLGYVPYVVPFPGIPSPFTEPAGLTNPLPPDVLKLVLGPASYVVGPSTVHNFSVVVDTNVASLQPSSMIIRFQLRTEWAPMLETNYYIMISANQGIFRPNIGTLVNQIQLVGTLPSVCTGWTFLTSAYGTLVIQVNGDSCIAALVANAVISFNIPTIALLPNPSAGIRVTFDVRIIPSYAGNWTEHTKVDSAALMDQFGYTTVAVCETIPYQLGAANDLLAVTQANRCSLVNAIAQISHMSSGILQCKPGGTNSNSQFQVTYAKISEGSWASNLCRQEKSAVDGGSGPQSYGMANIQITHWGFMVSAPIFAVVVQYPPVTQSLMSLGLNPLVPSTWQLVFIVKMDRLTTACSVVNKENPWQFTVATYKSVVKVHGFPTTPFTSTGIALEEIPGSAWAQNNNLLLVTVTNAGIVVGWASIAISPVRIEDGSDAAWYAFFAFFALPLFLLCCCLAWALWYFRFRSEPMAACCAEAPVQELYWVAQPVAPTVVVDPSPMCVTAPPATPIYLVQ